MSNLTREITMKKIVTFFRDLHEDESGVTFIEYTALLGVILAVGLLVLTAVGTWAEGTWAFLCSNLSATGAPGCVNP
jgi:Flp pilus assembly pilin Flp